MDYAGQIAAIGKSQAVIQFALSGEILSANQNFLNVMGYAAQEVIGQHHSMFVDPDEARDPRYAAFWQTLSRGEYVAGEFRRIGRDGRDVWIQASYNPIFDINGKPFKVVKFATDITADVERRDTMQQLSLVANGTGNSVIITDTERRIEYVNPGFERLTGYSAAEVLGRTPGEVLQGVHTDRDTVSRIRQALDRGDAFNDEILNYTKSGQPYWISLAINPVHGDDGKVERFISIQANINETKQSGAGAHDQTRRHRPIECAGGMGYIGPDRRRQRGTLPLGCGDERQRRPARPTFARCRPDVPVEIRQYPPGDSLAESRWEHPASRCGLLGHPEPQRRGDPVPDVRRRCLGPPARRGGDGKRDQGRAAIG